jgi:hypothetical protein
LFPVLRVRSADDGEEADNWNQNSGVQSLHLVSVNNLLNKSLYKGN